MPRIIVADDTKMILKTYDQILDYLGLEYELCENGRLALEAFVKKTADLVILDVQMPVMDGLEACRQIRQHPEGIAVPIVIVSSLDSEEDIMNGLNAGANDYLLKPIREAHLIAKLKSFLKTSALHKNDIDLVKSHTEFAGRYRIEKLLGYGAHSVVFLAKDKDNEDNNVAIKLLKKDFEAEDITKGFFQTAEQLKNIDSPNILKIYDYGQFNNRLYLVIEYAEGGDLAHIIKHHKLNEPEAVKLALDLTNALKVLENNGLLHLDIKPENIMITESCYKLGDFGLITTRETTTIPVNFEIWTTAAYLPPEYLTAETDLCSKSDVYSLGATLYEAITGDNPFQTDKPATSMYRQVNLMPTPLKECQVKFTNYFSDVLQAMLSKNIEERPDPTTLEEIFTNMENYLLINPPAEEEIVKDKPVPKTQISARKKKNLNARDIKTSLDKATRKVPKPYDVAVRAESILPWRTKEKLRAFDFLKYVAILIGILLFSYYVGYFFNYLTFGEKSVAHKLGSNSTVVCTKCGKVAQKRIRDISKAKCDHCGEKLAFQLICHDCNNRFPLIEPDTDNFEDIDEYMLKWDEANTCPKCKSPNTGPPEK